MFLLVCFNFKNKMLLYIMITDYDLKELAKKHNIPLNDVFMKDKPPTKIKQGGYIINLEDSTSGFGTHWVAVWFPKDKDDYITYFDSFGVIPAKSILNWICCVGKRSGYVDNTVIYSDKQIQNIHSGGCGIYALYFIDYMDSHTLKIKNSKSILEKFEKIWKNDTEKNLTLLKNYAPYYMNSD